MNSVLLVPVLLVNDLRRNSPELQAELQAAVERVLARGWYVLGPELERFEAEFAQWNGAAHCVGVANGTDALQLALRAVGVQANDLVATVANAGMYSTTAIRAMGAIPAYVEVEQARLTMDAEALAHLLRTQPKIKAVIVTHLYGQLADLDSLLSLTAARGIPLIEDCAQAHGAQRNGRKAGTFGDIGCFSFYPTKNLGACGDGGALLTANAQLAERLRSLRQYGWGKKYVVEHAGGCNSRLDEMQAAILSAKLPRLAARNERRRAIAQRYQTAFAALPLKTPSLLDAHTDKSYVAHLYVIRVAERAALQAYLQAHGIGFDIHYPVPDHCQPIAQKDSVIVSALAFTERLCGEVLTLPCFPEMTEAEVEHVIQVVTQFFRSHVSAE